MRALGLLLAGGLGLLAAACGSRGKIDQDDVVPVGKYRELIVGHWQTTEEKNFIQGYEFARDGTLKMTLKGMADPVRARFTWTDDRQLEIEYQAPEAVKKRYAAAVKAYKEPTQKKLDEGKMDERAEHGLRMSLNTIPDELPARQKVGVILAEQPRELLLVSTEATRMTFKRAKGRLNKGKLPG